MKYKKLLETFCLAALLHGPYHHIAAFGEATGNNFLSKTLPVPYNTLILSLSRIIPNKNVSSLDTRNTSDFRMRMWYLYFEYEEFIKVAFDSLTGMLVFSTPQHRPTNFQRKETKSRIY